MSARRSNFRKSLGGVILEISKAAPGFVIESQRLVFEELKEHQK